MFRLRLGIVTMILSQLVSFFFPMSFAVDADCNYQQNMDIGVTYYIYNSEYPSNYGPRKTCRWVAIAPQGYKIQIACEVQMPQSNGCSMDRLLISLTGNPNLENAHTYCGIGSFTLETEYNNITVGLVTAYNSPGGRFLCSIQAIENSVPPSQCDCGWKGTRRIVGGVETKVNEYPMMAALVDFRISDIVCGATIIAQQYALTAAHCFYRRDPETTGLLIGEHNITSGAETNSTKLLRIAQFIPHPMYDQSAESSDYDIGVLRTQTYIEYTMQVGPVCLPFRDYQNSFAGDVVTALGWGTTDFTGPKSEVLLKTDLDVLTVEDCRLSIGGKSDQMCTFRQGHDACQSDSGGPLLILDERTYRIKCVGIIASGFGCASDRPGLNTRVTSYLMWILSVTPDAEYCVK